MAAYTGKNLYVNFIYSTDKGGAIAGTVVLTSESMHRSLELTRSADTADVSAGTVGFKEYLITLEDTTLRYTCIDKGTQGSAIRRACDVGNHGTLEFGPEGTASGKPKYSLPVHVTGFETSLQYAGETQFTVNLQGDGAWISNFEVNGDTY